MKFKFSQGELLKGQLIYIKDEDTFDFLEAIDVKRRTAVLVVTHTLQLEFDIDTGRLLYVWGYSPVSTWHKLIKTFSLENARPGQVFVSDVDDDIQPGSGYDTSLDGSAIYATDSHVIVGEIEGTQLVEIAQGVYIGLVDHDIQCVILKYELVKSHPRTVK